MKHYPASTIAGTIFIFAVACALVYFIVWFGFANDIFSNSGPQGAQIYERHGFLSLLLKHWLIIVLIIFPLGLTCMALLFGYHKAIINIIKNWKNPT